MYVNFFDYESKIIECLQGVQLNKVFLSNDIIAVKEVFTSIHDAEKWKLWSNSSGKSDPPPDFYNDKLKVMMDVMRIDDHAFENKNGKIVNPTNQQ